MLLGQFQQNAQIKTYCPCRQDRQFPVHAQFLLLTEQYVWAVYYGAMGVRTVRDFLLELVHRLSYIAVRTTRGLNHM